MYEGYPTVGLYENGKPGEVFVRFSKICGREGCLLDAWCTMVSIGLQCGMPVSVAVQKFRHWQFEPKGLTEGKDVHSCSSPIDYIAQWLDLRFGKKKEEDDAEEDSVKGTEGLSSGNADTG